MKRIAWLLVSSFFNASHADINHYFDEIKSDPARLNAFLQAMPKGGELHYHLAGGARAETLLNIGKEGSYCLDRSSFVMTKTDAVCDAVSSLALPNDPALYKKTVRAWSMKDFLPTPTDSGHDHFFSSFGKFNSLVYDHQAAILAGVMRRAAHQHVLYLEIMMNPDNLSVKDFLPLMKGVKGFAAQQQRLLASKPFQQRISQLIQETKQLMEDTHETLGCKDHPTAQACGVVVKFQYYVLREQPIEQVFIQALSAFAAASLSRDVVGVNLVQAEDGPLSLHDYEAQMALFKFMHHAYPSVHIALHAGELTRATAPSTALHDHIYKAVFIGQAERIGHGVDIAQEDKVEPLLAYMAKKPIPVEINLTSNADILGVKGAAHPLALYLAHHVPVVLSTDDEGILRTNLTKEYAKAVLEHGLDYTTLKTINRNALTYSFLQGQSLWSDAAAGIPVPACETLTSVTCLQFIKHSEKATLQWTLEKQLHDFESLYSPSQS